MLYLALGSPTTELSLGQLREALVGVLDALEPRRRVLAVPPDFSRYASRAGELTCMVHDYYGDALVDVLPAIPLPQLADRRRNHRHGSGRVRHRGHRGAVYQAMARPAQSPDITRRP